MLLKESQTIKLAQQTILPSISVIIPYAVIHTFGEDSEEARYIKDVQFSFDTPVVATDSERAETAARFAAAVNSLRQAGVPISTAINITQQFFRDIKISQEDLELIKTSENTAALEKNLSNAKEAQALVKEVTTNAETE